MASKIALKAQSIGYSRILVDKLAVKSSGPAPWTWTATYQLHDLEES